jgi:hypothetical protein
MTKKKENPQLAGRKTLYKPEYCEHAYKLTLLGAIDIQLADFFNISVATLNNWKLEYPEFLESLKKGKENADAEIAQALYHRAKGYSHPDLDIKMFNGEIIETPLIKHYPPDTGACMAWLKNRQPNLWRDKTEVVNLNTNLNIESNIDKAKELKKLLDKNG